MINKIAVIFFMLLLKPISTYSQVEIRDTVIAEKLLYHSIRVNSSDQTILPWYSSDLGTSYDFVIGQVWSFWYGMRIDKNGLPYYMNHQVWRADFNDRRGIGGDQLAMALSSWNLLYGYSGNETIKEEMKFIADYYLTHSLSPPAAKWPNIPYPYNTLIYSGIYDGDMILGKEYTQPDKAGSLGLELVHLYKMTAAETNLKITENRYIDAAVKIANTLANNIKKGDANTSPLPFKVNAITGEVGTLKHNSGNGDDVQSSSYTSNWTGTMELFLKLIEMNVGNVEKYQEAFNDLLMWMKNYPLKNNKWGPFFEDIPGWSDTQINAITFAQFMMNHREYFPNWQSDVAGIFRWVYQELGNNGWEKYGVKVVNEQTAYQTPGNSHTARQACAELQYSVLSGDNARISNAVRQLSWATYMVDDDGKNRYPGDEVWMTDGYGDYVRHYLRAMALRPELAPENEHHLLSSTSVIQLMEYAPEIHKFWVPELPAEHGKNIQINYRTFDAKSTETFRVSEKPGTVLVNGKKISESDRIDQEGWNWMPFTKGGLLIIRHSAGNRITVFGK